MTDSEFRSLAKKYTVVLDTGERLGSGPVKIEAPTTADLRGVFRKQPGAARTMKKHAETMQRIWEASDTR